MHNGWYTFAVAFILVAAVASILFLYLSVAP